MKVPRLNCFVKWESEPQMIGEVCAVGNSIDHDRQQRDDCHNACDREPCRIAFAHYTPKIGDALWRQPVRSVCGEGFHRENIRRRRRPIGSKAIAIQPARLKAAARWTRGGSRNSNFTVTALSGRAISIAPSLSA